MGPMSTTQGSPGSLRPSCARTNAAIATLSSPGCAGIVTGSTAAGPTARTARAATTEESMPPDKPNKKRARTLASPAREKRDGASEVLNSRSKYVRSWPHTRSARAGNEQP